MSDRQIFPDLRLFKKSVTERFLVSLREIYKNHPVYTYADTDSANTAIHIEPTYANLTFEGRNPQMLVKVGQYEFGLQDTLGMNLNQVITNASGVYGGFESLKNMSTMVTVVVKAYAEEESSDIADELAMLGVYAARNMFTQTGINIRGSAISETVVMDQQANLYQTIINFQVDVPWQLSTVSDAQSLDPAPTYTGPDPLAGDYTEPGVYVFQKNS